MTECVVQTRSVSKFYGKLKALDDVSINVKSGEIYGLIGDNGAGKSTLLKVLAGHIRPEEGEVSILSSDSPRGLSAARRQIGAMIEKPGFFPNLSVENNLEYCRLLKGIPDRNMVRETLRMVGLTDKAAAKSGQLSMGMKQRLGLAIALIGQPRILILDEPINGLDPSGIHELRELIKKLNRQRGMTILLSSHILAELQQAATTFGFIAKGRIIEEITLAKLTEKCADYIEMSLSDPEAYAALIDRVLKGEKYVVMPDRKVRIYGPKHSAYEYSKLAAEHSIAVGELELHKRSLEDYYMNIREGKNV